MQLPLVSEMELVPFMLLKFGSPVRFLFLKNHPSIPSCILPSKLMKVIYVLLRKWCLRVCILSLIGTLMIIFLFFSSFLCFLQETYGRRLAACLTAGPFFAA